MIPTVDCEASETDLAVEALEDRLNKTVKQVYLKAASTRIDARELGISEVAVHARIWDAHRRLANWFTDRHASALQERDRLELLRQTGYR